MAELAWPEPAGPGLGRLRVPRSSLHRSGGETTNQPSANEQEEDHCWDGVDRGCGHDRPPCSSMLSEEVSQEDRQRICGVVLAKESQREDELVVSGDESEDAGGDQPRGNQREQYPKEDLGPGGAVDRSGFFELFRHGRDEVAQHPDGY